MNRKHLRDYGHVAGKKLKEAYSEPRSLLTINYCCKKLHLRCLTGFWMLFWSAVTFVKFRRFLKDGTYEESKQYCVSNDYLSDEEDNFLADINGELVSMFSKEHFC